MSTKQRKATGPRFTNGKNPHKALRPSSSRNARIEHDLDEPTAQAARVPGHDEIAMRAFEIYLSRGEWPGRDLEDWLEAERQLQVADVL